jgi:hypothetical protein
LGIRERTKKKNNKKESASKTSNEKTRLNPFHRTIRKDYSLIHHQKKTAPSQTHLKPLLPQESVPQP